ncbi:hypothetical protein SPBR_00316 [Sporothrix brasiliensis 5110]|uniref:Uncharacterized protein n=1 Tax=Sporothrix brasiliensis 5110 TaxID=1398154 RepID=A0A0C2EUY9_9PEZI|nr:uncharacterized protein SPBR_00316 [Sporothrix brasiliensis 5110]KIH90384.1 hypothetical protein SPBR_00316 [Sporothrix brasiliensis 5110]
MSGQCCLVNVFKLHHGIDHPKSTEVRFWKPVAGRQDVAPPKSRQASSEATNWGSSSALAETSLDVQSYVLAALTATGGVIGFARTGSVPSVVAGVAVGVLYGLGGLRQQNRQPYGVELSLLASVVLGGASIPRAIRLRKPVPVMLSLIAAYGLYKFGSAYFRKP